MHIEKRFEFEYRRQQHRWTQWRTIEFIAHRKCWQIRKRVGRKPRWNVFIIMGKRTHQKSVGGGGQYQPFSECLATTTYLDALNFPMPMWILWTNWLARTGLDFRWQHVFLRCSLRAIIPSSGKSRKCQLRWSKYSFLQWPFAMWLCLLPILQRCHVTSVSGRTFCDTHSLISSTFHCLLIF